MAKNSKKQSGSTLAVCVLILVLAVIGVLGFIFWQNFINKKATDAAVVSNTADEAKVDVYAGWNTYESINSGYSIKYPKDWIALKETVQDGPYIRNFDPTSKQSQGGYPEGYINIRVLREENDENFKAKTGYTTTQWYDELGEIHVQDGPVGYSAKDVKELKVNGLAAKSAKAVFTETDEVIYLLRGDKLYSINLYPYGVSSDVTVKLMLDSFRFTY